VVSTTTKFAEDKKLGLGSATTQDGVVFTYSGATPGVQPEVGSVLFVNVGDEMYLRRVDSVESTAQGLVVRTSDGQLSDVLETGTIDTQVTLFDVSEAALHSGSGSGVKTTRSSHSDGSEHYVMRWRDDIFTAKQTNHASKDNDVEIVRGMRSGEHTVRVKKGSTRATEQSAEVKATVGFKPSIEAKVRIEGTDIKEAKVIARGELRAEIGISYKFEASGSVKKEFELFSRTFPLRYFIGGVPVYQLTTLNVKAVLSAEASTEINAEAIANAVAGIEIGVQLNPETKTWETIPPTPSFDKSVTVDVNVHGKVVGKIRLIPNLQLEFYRVLATDISIEPFLTCTVVAETIGHADILESHGYLKTQLTQFDVDLQAQAFIGVSLFKLPILKKTQIWESDKWMLFSLPKLSASGGSGEVNESITLSATTEDGKNNPFNDGSIKWDVDPKEGSASGGKPGTFTAGKEGTYTVFFSGHSRLPDPFGRQFAMADVTVGPEKEKPKKPDGPKASTNGDPHLYTFDNLAYDFQAEGEFILAKSTVPNDSFEVQVRQKPWSKEQTGVAVTQGAAMNVAGDKVGFYLKQKPVSHINGIPQELPDGSITPLPQGGKIFRKGLLYSIVWPNGGGLVEVKDNNWGFLVSTYISKTQAGQLIGLLGNGDGDRKNDLVMRDGTPLGTKISFDTLYPNYANSWRITQQESLFDYAPGETTETFTDRNFPRVLSKANGLSAEQRANAEQVCRAAGITDITDAGRILLEDCILDVGATKMDLLKCCQPIQKKVLTLLIHHHRHWVHRALDN